MSIAVEIDGVAIPDAIQPSSISAQSIAKDGDVGFGGFLIDDAGADITTTGHKWVTVEESDCAQPRLFTGLLTERAMSRSTDRGMLVADDRLHDATLVDLNAVFSLRIITYAGGKRPEETMAERLTWLLGYQALVNLVEDTGFVDWDILGLGMDSADYTGQTPKAVLDDLVGRRPSITYFAFWDQVAEARALYFGSDSVGIAESSLAISNEIADINPTTGIYAPDSEAKLRRTPEEVYSEVMVTYADGTKRAYRKRGSTSEAFIARGTTIDRPFTQRLSTAQAQAEAFLDNHATETDTITTTILVFPEDAGLVTAGQRMNVRFTHLGTPYESWTSMRVVSVNVRPANDLANRYYLDLELEKPRAGTAPSGCACSGTVDLVQYATVGGDDYAMVDGEPITLSATPTCGNLLVMIIYARDITNDEPAYVQPTGFTNLVHSYYFPEDDVPRAKYIGVFYRYVEDGDGATWTADYSDPLIEGGFGGSGLLYLGEYSGVQIDGGEVVRAMLQNDTTPDFPPYTPATDQTTIVCAAVHWQPSEEQTIVASYNLVFDSGPSFGGDRHRMALWDQTVASPSGSYTGSLTGLTDLTTDTHIVQFGLVACGADEEFEDTPPALPAGSPVYTAEDPTPSDDVTGGYSVGQIWINSATGQAWVLVDNTANDATWLALASGDHEHVWQDDLSASADGSETTFVTTSTFALGTTLVALNGLVQQPGVDYTEATDGLSIEFADAPLTGDVVHVAYETTTTTIPGGGEGGGPVLPETNPYVASADHDELLLVQIHAHTTGSDGSYTPQQVVDYYASAGYDALVITDHDKVTAQPAGIDTPITGNELSPSTAHVLSLNSDYVRGSITDLQALITAVNADGGDTVMAHANYSTGITYSELVALSGYLGIEIFNMMVEDISPITYPGWAVSLWDQMLTNHRTDVWGFATDDLHSITGRRGYDCGRTLVWVGSASAANIMAALADGNFVADVANFGVTPGWPTLTSTDLSVTCTGATRIEAWGAAGLLDSADDDNLTYTFVGDETYVRLVAVGDYTEPFDSAIDTTNRWGVDGGTWTVGSGVLSQTLTSDVVRIINLKRHIYGDFEMTVDIRLNTGGGNDTAGPIFRLGQYGMYYLRLEGGVGMQLWNKTGSTFSTPLASYAGTVSADTWYRLRFKFTQSTHTFQARYWAVADAEPGTWQIETTSSTFDHGWIGFYTRGAHDFDNLWIEGFKTFYQPVTVTT